MFQPDTAVRSLFLLLLAVSAAVSFIIIKASKDVAWSAITKVQVP